MRIVLFMAIAILFTGFAAFKKAPVTIQSGTYGVCDCESGGNSMIKLTINPDHTYRYTDKTIEKSFDATGNWSLKGNDLVLENAPKGAHDKWSVSGEGECIKSRHGVNWRRLCKIKGCE